MATHFNCGGKIIFLNLNLDNFSAQSLNKYLLESVATLDVEEQLWLGSE